MHILFVALGSAGDVHPLIGLGKALRARGHRVTVITNNSCEPVVRAEGLEYIGLAKEAGWRRALRVDDLRGWRGWQELLDRTLIRPTLKTGLRRWRKLARSSTALGFLRPVYRAIAERAIPGDTVVVAGHMALGARIAQEHFGIPLATVHLSPASLHSVVRPPVLPAWSLPPGWPRWAKRFALWLRDVGVLDRVLAGPVNAFRAELGLPPVRRLFAAWRDSPQRVLGLFPEWFARPPRDWPSALRLTGFVHYDESGQQSIPHDVQEFLDRGEAPIVFTAGSAFRRERRFFHEAVDACRLLRRRGLLLTRYPDQVPEQLPDGVRHCAYVPLSQLLPSAAALVSYGGIGTAAQALAAGIPHVVAPHKHDQPENAARLTALGVARTIPPHRFRAPAVAEALDGLLRSPAVRARCGESAQRLRRIDAVAESCRLIEELGRPGQSRAA